MMNNVVELIEPESERMRIKHNETNASSTSGAQVCHCVLASNLAEEQLVHSSETCHVKLLYISKRVLRVAPFLLFSG